jgi:hypothetical protein
MWLAVTVPSMSSQETEKQTAPWAPVQAEWALPDGVGVAGAG